MQSLSRNALNIIRGSTSSALCISSRHISLTGAIERGLRQSQKSLDKRYDRRDSGYPDERPAKRTRYGEREREQDADFNSEQHIGDRRFDRNTPPVPRNLPYTTAASEYIYGTFAVNAAIRSRRRKLYKLYMHGRDDGKEDIGSASLRRRAEAAGVQVIQTSGNGWKFLFDRLTDRPHNGCILEASAIPVLPVTSLANVAKAGDPVATQVGQLTSEDVAIAEAFGVVDRLAKLPMRTRPKRYPVVLLLDRITDLGNLGAILRSGYFFGVNAVVLLDHGTAPLSGVTVKASAGAAELLPILRIKDETGFITASKANGWHFVAAISPEDTPLVNNRVSIPEFKESTNGLKENPIVLMLGNEGEGLRPRISRMSNSTVTIQDAVSQHFGLDSLNVSVAAGILMHDLLRPFLGNKSTGS